MKEKMVEKTYKMQVPGQYGKAVKFEMYTIATRGLGAHMRHIIILTEDDQ